MEFFSFAAMSKIKTAVYQQLFLSCEIFTYDAKVSR